MSEVTRAFLDGMLLKNPVFMTFTGALLAAVIPRSARTSWAPAARYSVVFFFAALLGGALANSLSSALVPLVFVGTSLVSVLVLRHLGELSGEWMGMPSAILAIAPLLGIQMLVAQAGEFAGVVASAGGNSLGFFLAFVLLGAIRETSRISEAKPVFKTNPVVLFSMAVFALALVGFIFW